MIAPGKPQSRPAQRPAAEASALAVVDELTLGRVTAWPAERARALLAADDWRARLVALVREDEPFRTAILIASRGLRPVVERVRAGGTLDEREAARLLAYATRMASRTTPFGLFASVGPVAFGAEERRVDGVTARVPCANVDHEWLVGAVDAVAEKAFADGDDVVVVRATALRREGSRFALLDERKVLSDGAGSQYRSVTIAASPPVECALEHAAAGCSADALAALLAERFSVERERARSLVRKLVEARFLIPAARPAPLDDAHTRLASFARGQHSLTPLVDALRAIPTPVPGIPAIAALDATVEQLKAVGPADIAQPVFYDSTHRALALPENVRDDVVRLADVLIRSGGREHLDAYRDRFVTRYESSERLVPLLELVGPHGIGIPSKTEVERKPLPPARRARLAALIGDALRARTNEIALSDADWAAIRADLPDPLPPSLEAGFHVLAPSFDAVAAGEYRIVSSPLVATYGAGKTTGRFAKYQDDDFRARLRAVVAAEAPPGALTAEPLFVPERARSGNVIAHPVVAEAVIPINAYAEGVDVVAPDDLLVGIAQERIALWSRSRGRRVHVVWPHAFNPNLSPPLARFFAFVARDGGRMPSPFDVGELAMLPFVPRIRLGRVVLRRATWTFTVEELRARDLAQLARERAIPRLAVYGEFDNVLLVDTQTEAGAALLRDQTRSLKPEDLIVLGEAMLDDDDLWLRDADGARYPGEFIASIRSTAPPPKPQPAPFVVAEATRTQTPASPWCYLKLYANDREFRSEIAPHVLRFAEEATASGLATHWFYLLYRDPDQHVRVRLRAASDPAALREQTIAFAETLAQSGVVNRYLLATYERELERYGGPDGLDLCEHLFHRDSVDALRAPGADLLSGRERLDALLPPLLALFDALTTEDERARWVEARRPSAKRATREEAEVLKLLADAPPPAPDDERIALGRAVAAHCGEANPYIDVVDSLLHMHCNRRGVSVDEERDLRRILWKALFSRRSRAPRGAS